MKTLYELMKYHFQQYFKSTKYIMPFAVLLAVLYCMYAQGPVAVTDSFSIACIYVFLIMIWVGLTYGSLENEVSEQILVLRSQSGWKYYFSDTLFLVLLGVAAASISTLFPVVKNLMSLGHLFNRPLTISDIISAMILQSVSAFVGSATGAFFHQRVMKDRGAAILLTAFVAIMSVAELVIRQWMPVSKYFNWIFPPVAPLSQSLCGYNTFNVGMVLHAIIIMVVYGAVITVIKIWLMERNKF